MADTPNLELLKSKEQVQAYLDSITDPSFPEAFRSPLSSFNITNGIGNAVHRLVLNTSISNNPTSTGTVILKHSNPYIFNIDGQKFVWDLWPFEANALQDVPHTEVVKAPKLYWVDHVNRVMFTEDAGPQSQNLKDLLLSDEIPQPKVFSKIGEELGAYLAQLHSWGRDTKVLEKYENKDSRVIASWRTYGRFEDALIKAYPELSENLKQKVAAYCAQEKDKALHGNEIVIMGDFWTGNVLVNLTETGELESLYIVDWEMVRPADAATELSQMLAEVWEAGEFSKNLNAKPAAKSLSEGLCSTYRSQVEKIPEGMLKEVMLAAGAHIVVWGEIGFAVYGDEGKFKEVKDKATQFIRKAFGEEVESQDWGFGALKP
ncbi:hypothetical protein AOL_s00007g307 [Orbilia oligospora ATCC 24927]|uniref:Aminoglycoside phosphotransferase domain-containing protein n=1 Tax=Arthrobotrys oligospora (strain ATCC 24927 / CBS 115.81 / DSM 1491) TaxID=756982 RepID=G1X1Z8_ARTOA|nr:hypothetical protein AOL_s00007g307 [Orbilia oligospora ATCC 24927]EGX52971.1 hypothetical protein AOL_s00007g307 [Orbilia oligospora ATCC 24927]